MANKLHFDRDTAVELVIDEFAKIKACAEGIEWCNKFKGKTFGELADSIGDPAFDQCWGAWFFVKFGKYTAVSIRKQIINKINSSAMSLHLYLKVGYLTDEEDTLLVRGFQGKMPNAEREFAAGIVKRVKK